MPNDFEINALLAGWAAARSGADTAIWSETLLSRSGVLDLALAVEAPPDDELSPLLLWIPSWVRIHQSDPGSRPRIALPVACIAVQNARRRSLVRTLSLLLGVSDNGTLFRLACILAALHGLRASGGATPEWSSQVVSAICGRLGLEDVYSIWHYAGRDTLPLLGHFAPPPECSPHDFGFACARFMSIVYRQCFPARIFPVRDHRYAGPRIKELRACHAGVNQALNDPYGNADWRTIDRDTLEALVWTEPRMRLRHLFGVSDRAIAKRCESWGIPQPPRGFWQKVANGKHPGGVLEANGVMPPENIDLLRMLQCHGQGARWRGPDCFENRSETLGQAC